jgi:hypothetical protein
MALDCERMVPRGRAEWSSRAQRGIPWRRERVVEREALAGGGELTRGLEELPPAVRT